MGPPEKTVRYDKLASHHHDTGPPKDQQAPVTAGHFGQYRECSHTDGRSTETTSTLPGPSDIHVMACLT